MIAAIKNLLRLKNGDNRERSAIEAYDLWSDSYDVQPGNLMLDLDAVVFEILLRDIDLANKKIADIGCGTGRHWKALYERKPALVAGFDVSAGMLDRLRNKFPGALIQQTRDNLLSMLRDGFIDCLVTTLTLAHIENIDEAIGAWARVLKAGGDLIITDFHPDVLEKGGKRSFSHNGKSLSVTNYVHPLEKLKTTFNKYGLNIIKKEERYIDKQVRSYYEAQNALSVYRRFRGLPVIYGLHLKKADAAQ
jgi:ubiquinone/menaquinone biosynthesis C-methylase UbiE